MKKDKMSKKVLITQSNYIPWKGFFDSIRLADEVVLYDDMQYTKRDWRNRNKIKTAQGLKWLSIPVNVKGKYFQKINETTISDPMWKEDHWRVICSHYKAAPYFELYKDFFEDLYLNCNQEKLSEINFRFLNAICDLLKITTPFRWSSEFELRGDKSEKLLNICIDLGATTYLSGPAAKDYLETDMFIEKGIQVDWLDYTGYREYPQLFDGFEHGVSILDLIFNTGPEMNHYMKYSGE